MPVPGSLPKTSATDFLRHQANYVPRRVCKCPGTGSSASWGGVVQVDTSRRVLSAERSGSALHRDTSFLCGRELGVGGLGGLLAINESEPHTCPAPPKACRRYRAARWREQSIFSRQRAVLSFHARMRFCPRAMGQASCVGTERGTEWGAGLECGRREAAVLRVQFPRHRRSGSQRVGTGPVSGPLAAAGTKHHRTLR